MEAKADRWPFGIDPYRTLSGVELGRVRGRFMWWANTHRLPSPQPPPNFDEVRWNDRFTHVYVTKTSGLAALFSPATPVREDHGWAVYDRTSDAANVLLEAIRRSLDDA